MRIHAEDKGASQIGKVFLDGEDQKFCLAFDDEEGWVDRYIFGEEVTVQMFFGKVTYERFQVDG